MNTNINFSTVNTEGDLPILVRLIAVKGDKGDPGSVNVDEHYNPTSENAQSGIAVAEAVSTKQDKFSTKEDRQGDIYLSVDTATYLEGRYRFVPDPGADENDNDIINRSMLANYHDSTKADKSTVDNHIADKSNPHEVTKTQVGLGNVDNTSDLNKPISTATQAALNLKANSADVYSKTTTDTLLEGKENIIRDITPYIDYSVDSETDEVTITNLKSGVTPASLVGRFNIPSTIDNKTVTMIGNTCFSDCINADFILPITLKTIGGSSYSSGAFSNTNISNITLSAGVSLGAGAFANCLNLKSVYIPDGTIFGKGVFFNCANLTQVEFGGSITPNENIFRGCKLYQVILPETLTSIPQSVFYNNTDLKKVYLPKSVTSIIAQNSFYNVTLTDLYFGGTEAEFNDKSYKTVFTSMSGITIHYNCKPAIMQDIYDYHDNTKQDKLTAGTNITIDHVTNVISSTGGGGGTVDQTYDPTSTNAQSGTAVAGAIAPKLTEPSSNLAVGKYFRVASIDADGHAVLECVDPPTAPVQSISAAGTALTPDASGNVNIPQSAFNTFGLVKGQLDGVRQGIQPVGQYGYWLHSTTDTEINATATRTRQNDIVAPILVRNLDYAVKAAMTDGIGAAWTDAERLAALARLGCTVEADGTVKWAAQPTT